MPGIEMIPVKSSNVKTIGYDRETRKLRVEFLRPGDVFYEYSDVTLEKWQSCDLTGSVGEWLHKKIIGKYACRKIQETKKCTT